MRPKSGTSADLLIGAFGQHWYRIGAPAGNLFCGDLIEGRCLREDVCDAQCLSV